MQVSHAPSVVEVIEKVQAAVCEHSPHLKKACVDAVSSHLTLVSSEMQGPHVIVSLCGDGSMSVCTVRVRQQGGDQGGFCGPMCVSMFHALFHPA